MRRSTEQVRERIQVICARRYFPVSQPNTSQKDGTVGAEGACVEQTEAYLKKSTDLSFCRTGAMSSAPLWDRRRAASRLQIRHWPDHPLRALW